MCRGLPWSTGINRDVQGRDSEILNMLKITGLCRGQPRWSSVLGSAMQAPCWCRDLPCLRRGIPYWRPDVPYIFLCHCTLSMPGVRTCWLWTWSWTWARKPSSCQTSSFILFVFFLWIFVDVDGSAIKLIMILNRKSVFFNRDPDFAGLYRGLPCWRRGLPGWRRGLPCRHRGLPCWDRGVPDSTVITPGWRRDLPCRHRVNAGVCRVGTVLTSGSAVFTPGWWSSSRPLTWLFPISSR